MDTAVQNFLTPTSLATLGGTSVAVMAITNTLRTLFKWNSPLVGFITALVVTLLAATISGALHRLAGDVIWKYTPSTRNPCMDRP